MLRYSRFVAHCTILAVDVEGFGDRSRTMPHQLAIRNGLYHALRQAFGIARIPWEACHREDRGDGAILLAPPQVPKAPFVESLPYAVVAGLRQHNSAHPDEERIRLRMALHAGEVAFDDHGVTSSSLNHAFRLLAAPPLKAALAESRGVLTMITSDWFFDEVVRHSSGADHTEFRPAQVEVKETSTLGWIARPDYPYPADPGNLAVLRPREPAAPQWQLG
jgi:hypothetical protein